MSGMSGMSESEEPEEDPEVVWVEQRIQMYAVENGGTMPSEEQVEQWRGSAKLFMMLCMGFERRTGQPMNEARAGVLQTFVDDVRTRTYYAQELAIMAELETQWKQDHGKEATRADDKKLAAMCFERLAEDKQMLADFEAAQDEMCAALTAVDEDAQEREAAAKEERHQMEQETERHQFQMLTNARRAFTEAYGREPAINELQGTLASALVPELLGFAASEELRPLEDFYKAFPPLEGPREASAEQVESVMRAWAERFVAPLKLCPFAGSATRPLHIYTAATDDAAAADDADDAAPTFNAIMRALAAVWQAAEAFDDDMQCAHGGGGDAAAAAAAAARATALVPLPALRALHWPVFEAFCELVTTGLRARGTAGGGGGGGGVALAPLRAHGYHPRALAAPRGGDAAHLRRRAPWPTVHLVRRDALAAAGAGISAAEFGAQLAEANDARLRRMGEPRAAAAFAACLAPPPPPSDDGNENGTDGASARRRRRARPRPAGV